MGLLSVQFGGLGKAAENHPLILILPTLMFSSLLLCGIDHWTCLTSVDDLFVPSNSQGLKDKDTVERIFPVNEEDFIVGHETSLTQYPELLITITSNNHTK